MIQAFFEDPELQKFFLIFTRLTGLLVFAPPFFNRRLALQLKGGFAFFLAIVMFPTVKQAGVIIPATFPDLALALGVEMLIGFMIGFGIQIMFSAFQLAGELIDRQIGFAMASLVDPQTDITVSILGFLMQNLSLFIFLDFGGHLWMIKTFAGSFASLPLLGIEFDTQGMMYHISQMMALSFKFAVEFSMPVVIIILLVHIAQGFIQRTIPQLQVFTVGFILVIVVGLYSVRAIMQQLIEVSENLIEKYEQDIWFMISNL